jgi:hypothetical protein
MSKPLELTVFPRLERPRIGAEIMPYQEQWRREAALQGSKHLTDAELAAIYWQARDDADYRRHRVDMGSTTFPGLSADEAEEFERLMLRFATIPDYFEDES